MTVTPYHAKAKERIPYKLKKRNKKVIKKKLFIKKSMYRYFVNIVKIKQKERK